MENVAKLTEIKELITKRFIFLEKEEGYKLSSINFRNLENSESDKFSILPQINIFFSNAKCNRVIQLNVTITYTPSLYIRNTNTEEYFVHNNYFRFLYNKNLMFDDLEGQNSKEKIENFLTLIIKEFRGALHNVINGNEWINVPEDWGPYK